MTTEEKIAELQLLEQNIQSLSLQKQRFQTELMETENALSELSKTKDVVYKIINGIMFAKTPEELTEELTSKKDILELRIKSIEKQEQKS